MKKKNIVLLIIAALVLLGLGYFGFQSSQGQGSIYNTQGKQVYSIVTPKNNSTLKSSLTLDIRNADTRFVAFYPKPTANTGLIGYSLDASGTKLSLSGYTIDTKTLPNQTYEIIAQTFSDNASSMVTARNTIKVDNSINYGSPYIWSVNGGKTISRTSNTNAKVVIALPKKHAEKNPSFGFYLAQKATNYQKLASSSASGYNSTCTKDNNIKTADHQFYNCDFIFKNLLQAPEKIYLMVDSQALQPWKANIIRETYTFVKEIPVSQLNTK